MTSSIEPVNNKVPNNSLVVNLCRKTKRVMPSANSNSDWPTARTGATVCRANAPNHPIVEIEAKNPASNPIFHNRSVALSSDRR